MREVSRALEGPGPGPDNGTLVLPHSREPTGRENRPAALFLCRARVRQRRAHSR